MINEMEIAKILYASNPTRFNDKVDGECTAGWEHAYADKTHEFYTALQQASKLMTYFRDTVTFSSEDLAKTKATAKSLRMIGLMGPSRGGISKDTGDLMCDGAQIITALLTALSEASISKA